jgi:predicted dehydrogenase
MTHEAQSDYDVLAGPVRVGIIGAGSVVAARHLPNLQKHPDARVVAISRRSPEWLERIAADFNISGRYSDYRAMLDQEELDAVVIASPAGLHYEHARAALEHGLHVFVEKPMVLEPAHGEELVALARRARRLLAVGFDRRCHAHYRYARQVVAAGHLGEVRHVVATQIIGLMPILRGEPGDRGVPRMRGTHSDPVLAGGGILINTGSHVLDACAWLSGQRLAEVVCRTGFDELPVETRAAVAGRLERGALVSLVFEANAPGDWSWNERMTIYGTKGALTLTWPVRPDALPEHLAHDGRPLQVDAAELPAGTTAMANFVDALLGRTSPACTGEEALHIVRAVAACYESARRGQAVAVV